MKKSYIIGIVVAVIVVIGISLGSGYNKMVKENENVESAAAQIDVQLKRRTDLIPNLVNTVKGYMTHEQKVIDSITTDFVEKLEFIPSKRDFTVVSKVSLVILILL